MKSIRLTFSNISQNPPCIFSVYWDEVDKRFKLIFLLLAHTIENILPMFPPMWLALRYTSGDGTPAGISPAGSNATTTSSSFTSSAVSPWRDPAARLASHLVNIRAIVNHFTAKINAWATAHCLASLTEEQVKIKM